MALRLTSVPIRSVLLAASLGLPAIAPHAMAGEAAATRTTIVEAVPAPLGAIRHVSAERTPSGFPVPRYVSLKFGTVNARTGPSRDHSIAYQYRRRGLPLIVVAETEMWRKVRDLEGDEAWVRKPALSGERSAVLLSETQILAKPESDARATARIERGALVRLESCEAGYCRIRTENGVRGFAARTSLWGAQSLD
ncbi:MAG: SH3 domain-containing protein [Litorimonas sp.]